MGKNEKTPITLDDVEYFYEDMTAQQQTLVDRKSTRLNSSHT